MTSLKSGLNNAELLLLTRVPLEELQNTMCIIGTCDRSMTDGLAWSRVVSSHLRLKTIVVCQVSGNGSCYQISCSVPIVAFILKVITGDSKTKTKISKLTVMRIN